MDDADSQSTPRERNSEDRTPDGDKRREKIFDDVVKIISSALEVSPTDITSDIDFRTDYPFDSLQLYEFVIDLEEAYDIRISDEALDGVKNLDDIVGLVYKLTGENNNN